MEAGSGLSPSSEARPRPSKETTMNAQETIRTRRGIRKRLDKPVPEDVLRQVLVKRVRWRMARTFRSLMKRALSALPAIIVFAALALPASSASPARAAETPARPNLLVLLTDDQRWDALGCMDNPVVQTPEMDRLAAEGTLFTNMFVTSSDLRRQPRKHLHRPLRAEPPVQLQPGMPEAKVPGAKLSALLRRAGYYTGFIGKYGVGDGRREIEGRELFDRWFGFYGQGTYFPQDHPGRHLDEVMVEQAGQFLDAAPADRPFCLSVSFKAAALRQRLRRLRAGAGAPHALRERRHSLSVRRRGRSVSTPCPSSSAARTPAPATGNSAMERRNNIKP